MFGAALTATNQIDVAARAIDAAARNLPLPSIGAEAHPPDFLARPSNEAGAHVRVAYWLAEAARPTRVGTYANSALLSQARVALSAAQAGIGWFDTTLLESTDQAIDRILYGGESALAAVGRTDVAAVLNRMRGQAPVQSGSVVGAFSRGLLGTDITTASGRSTAIITSGAKATAAVTLGLGAAALYFAWPFLMEAASVGWSASKAGAVAGVGERARRKFGGQ